MSEAPIVTRWKSCQNSFSYGFDGEDGYALREEGYIGFGCEHRQVVNRSAETRYMNDGDRLKAVAILHHTAKPDESSVIERLALSCQDCKLFTKKD